MILITNISACVLDCFTRRIPTTGYTKLNCLKELLSKMYPVLIFIWLSKHKFPFSHSLNNESDQN